MIREVKAKKEVLERTCDIGQATKWKALSNFDVIERWKSILNGVLKLTYYFPEHSSVPTLSKDIARFERTMVLSEATEGDL